MVTERTTVSLDEDARDALDTLAEQTGRGNSEIVRQALGFYAANQEVARADVSIDLDEYHEILASGEHALLDIDFLHTLLRHAPKDDEVFLGDLDRVAEYHAAEYASRFDDLEEVLDWVSICGFITLRKTDEETYHVVFPTEDVKWFMLRFIERSTAEFPFEIEVDEGVSKVFLRERPA
jgi:predicted transcriptional regulator